MGVSIHYKGRIDDAGRIGDLRRDLRRFADCREWELLDLTGQDESNILEMFAYPPGLSEAVLFLLDSGGRLHAPFKPDARGEESDWCSVKTQYAPLEAHVQIVELLRQIQLDHMPDLEVVDEGGYWDTEDIDSLQRAREPFDGETGPLSEVLLDEADVVETCSGPCDDHEANCGIH